MSQIHSYAPCNANGSVFVCTTKNCTNTAFVCQDYTNCLCQSKHDFNCNFKGLPVLIKKLNESSNYYRPIKQQILNKIKQLIGKLQSLYIQISKIFDKQMGQNIEKLKNNQYKKSDQNMLTGHQIYNAFQQLDNFYITQQLIQPKIHLIQISQIVSIINKQFNKIQNQNHKFLKTQSLDHLFFKQKQKISPFFAYLQLANNLQWSSQFKSKTIEIDKDIITQKYQPKKESQSNTLALIQPEIKNSIMFGIQIICQIKQIYFGIGFKNIIHQNKFGFKKFNTIGHGAYMFGSMGRTYSHHQQSKNNKQTIQNFSLQKINKLYAKFDINKHKISFHKVVNTKLIKITELNILQNHENSQLYGLVYLKGNLSCVRLLYNVSEQRIKIQGIEDYEKIKM